MLTWFWYLIDLSMINSCVDENDDCQLATSFLRKKISREKTKSLIERKSEEKGKRIYNESFWNKKASKLTLLMRFVIWPQ